LGNTSPVFLFGASTASLRYFHHDHLGSTAAVTDEAGKVIERMAFDPWGKRRNTNGLADTTDSIAGLTTDRGYTGHEHLDEMGIIHMNGRVFDPLIGRFMSADPYIQAPDEL
jgi:RHS repeat-associated protein